MLIGIREMADVVKMADADGIVQMPDVDKVAVTEAAIESKDWLGVGEVSSVEMVDDVDTVGISAIDIVDGFEAVVTGTIVFNDTGTSARCRSMELALESALSEARLYHEAESVLK